MRQTVSNPAPAAPLAERQARASAFFEASRDRLCAGLEALEDRAGVPLYDGPPGRFERLPWRRGDGRKDEGGGVGSILRGRLFEKAGVHVSAVHGEFSEEFRARVKGAGEDPRFWAGGISVIIHPRNPRVPAAHMNTRMVATTESWLAGGSDLTPLLDADRRADAPDALAFHAALKAACDRHNTEYYERYKAWCDRYFYLPHRNEPRGVGGIFFDHLASGDWDADFAFAQAQCNAFIDAYLDIAAKRMREGWSEAEREEQLVRRGRYVEFNLLYDQGTMFGLKTGGNVATILSSMPPVVKWP
jgi:coproporphyrinogen III oxidase